MLHITSIAQLTEEHKLSDYCLKPKQIITQLILFDSEDFRARPRLVGKLYYNQGDRYIHAILPIVYTDVLPLL